MTSTVTASCPAHLQPQSKRMCQQCCPCFCWGRPGTAVLLCSDHSACRHSEPGALSRVYCGLVLMSVAGGRVEVTEPRGLSQPRCFLHHTECGSSALGKVIWERPGCPLPPLQGRRWWWQGAGMLCALSSRRPRLQGDRRHVSTCLHPSLDLEGSHSFIHSFIPQFIRRVGAVSGPSGLCFSKEVGQE